PIFGDLGSVPEEQETISPGRKMTHLGWKLLRRPLTMGLALALLATRVFSAATSGTRGGQTSAEAQIRKTLADGVEAPNAGDRIRANKDIWAKDLVGWYPGQPDDTYETEIEGAKRRQGNRSMTVELTVNELMVRGNLAVVRDTWRFTRATPSLPAVTP